MSADNRPAWPYKVGPRTDPMDTTLRYRAMSILHGFVPDPLPANSDEARDVIAWASNSTARSYAAGERSPTTDDFKEAFAFKYLD